MGAANGSSMDSLPIKTLGKLESWISTPLGLAVNVCHCVPFFSARMETLFTRIRTVYSFVLSLSPYLSFPNDWRSAPPSSSIMAELEDVARAVFASIVFFYFDFTDESKKNAAWRALLHCSYNSLSNRILSRRILSSLILNRCLFLGFCFLFGAGCCWCCGGEGFPAARTISQMSLESMLAVLQIKHPMSLSRRHLMSALIGGQLRPSPMEVGGCPLWVAMSTLFKICGFLQEAEFEATQRAVLQPWGRHV